VFHNGTYGSIPNSAKPANALFPSFLARNPWLFRVNELSQTRIFGQQRASASVGRSSVGSHELNTLGNRARLVKRVAYAKWDGFFELITPMPAIADAVIKSGLDSIRADGRRVRWYHRRGAI
jgi:hypothetical protein